MSIFADKKTLRKHLVDLTTELVRFPSHVEEPLKTFELIEFIKSYFEKEKVNINSYVFGGLPSLVITFEETKHPNILLSGHIDIVASTTKYTAEEKDGLLYGAGAMDMKGGVACIMAVMKYFSQQREEQKDFPLPSLGLMITSDEEIGGQNGTRALIEKENYRPNFVIVNEGREKYDIVTKEKGCLYLKFQYKGQAAHTAYPWKGQNAVQYLMSALLDSLKMFPKPSDTWIPTASITTCHGGSIPNVIPDCAEATMNVRLTGGKKWSKAAFLERLQKHLPPNIEVREQYFRDVFYAEPKNPHVQLLRTVVRSITKKPVRFGENHGASDASIFSENHVPTIILGPAGNDHHTSNERVVIDSLVMHFEVLKKFIEEERTHFHDKPVQELVK